jgi:hypothetical protein
MKRSIRVKQEPPHPSLNRSVVFASDEFLKYGNQLNKFIDPYQEAHLQEDPVTDENWNVLNEQVQFKY